MRIKIGDFGLSRLSVQGADDSTASETGPLRWMAPECLTKRMYSRKSDIWAFGCVVIEILTRKVPFSDLSPLEASSFVAFQKGKPTIPTQCDENPQLKNVLELCLKLDPNDRLDTQRLCEML